MLRKPKAITKTIERRKRTNLEALAVGVLTINNNTKLSPEGRREAINNMLEPFTERETVEVTERRVA